MHASNFCRFCLSANLSLQPQPDLKSGTYPINLDTLK